MSDATKVIRDFIYIDIDRLYSLYSQINEGIANQVYKSWSKEGANRDAQGGRLGSRKSSEETATETVQETSNVILHDYIYNKLEESLSGAILKPEGVTQSNWQEVLGQAFLIKVEGMAEINDYQHLIHGTENFVSINGEIIYMTRLAEIQQEIKNQNALIEELQAHASSSTGGTRTALNGRITEAKRAVAALLDTASIKKKLLDEAGLNLEDQTASIAKVMTHFVPDSFEVTICPGQGPGQVVYRGVLDKQFLRLQPNYLRQIYEDALAKRWTMVGEVTHFIPESVAIEPSVEHEGVNVEAGLQEMVRSLISSLSEMGAALHKSNRRTEIRVRPLAIYQEVTLCLPTPLGE